jgi:F-type H+-transporting ATPase subunit a
LSVIFGLIFVFTDLFGAYAVGVGSGSILGITNISTLFLKGALIALIQAYVFTLCFHAVFIGMAAEEHHHEHDETSVAHAHERSNLKNN